MDVDNAAAPPAGPPSPSRSAKPAYLPETEVYLGLLTVNLAIAAQRNELALELISDLLGAGLFLGVRPLPSSSSCLCIRCGSVRKAAEQAYP
jgi:hypothetical protein